MFELVEATEAAAVVADCLHAESLPDDLKASSSSQSACELASVSWVQCDDCNKWRQLSSAQFKQIQVHCC